MSNNRRTTTIYIYPTHGGPITPMPLDVSAIETAVLKAPDGTSRDAAGAREIARQIRATFKKVQPDHHLPQLALFMRRMSNFQLFDGVVLALDGTIDDTSDVASQLQTLSEMLQRHVQTLTGERPVKKDKKDEVNDITSRLRTLFQDVERLGQAVNKEQHARQNLQIELQSWQKYRARYQEIKKKFEEQQLSLQHAEEEAQQARRDAHQAGKHETEAIQQISMLEARLQLAEQKFAAQKLQERPAGPRNEKELAELRHKLKNAQDAQQQLRDTVSSLEQENLALREEIRRMAEGVSNFDPAPDEMDQYRL